MVVETESLVGGDIHAVGKTSRKLDKTYNAIIDKGDKLRTDALAYQRLFLNLERAYALGLDVQLVGKR